jgi:hypothetical protein
MKKLLIILFSLISITSFGQYNYRYNPSNGVPINKALSPAQSFSTDGRSLVFDSVNFKWRDYIDTGEVKYYLYLPKFRDGHFSIYVHNGGTLVNGVWIGGSTNEWWFRNGNNDTNLIIKQSVSNLDTTRTDTTVTILNSAGSNAIIKAATRHLAGAMSAADKAKLDSSSNSPYIAYTNVQNTFIKDQTFQFANNNINFLVEYSQQVEMDLLNGADDGISSVFAQGGNSFFAIDAFGDSYGNPFDAGRVELTFSSSKPTFLDADNGFVFRVNGDDSIVDFNLNGSVKFHKYGTGFAKFDASGNISSTTISTSDVSGLSAALALKINISDTASMLNSYQTSLNGKVKYIDTSAMLAAYQTAINGKATSASVVKYTDTASMLLAYQTALNLRIKYTDSAAMLAAYQTALNNRVKYSDTASMLLAYQNAINSRLKYTDTSAMLSAYQTAINSKVNIYNSDGTITGNRNLTLGSNTFKNSFDGSNYWQRSISSAGIVQDSVVGTAPTFRFGRNVNDAVTLVTFNQGNASATGLLTDFQLAGVSKASITSAGALSTSGGIFSGGTLTAGGGIFSTFVNTNQANFSVTSGTSAIGGNTTALLLPTGVTSATYRIVEAGVSKPVVTANDAYISHIIGAQTWQEATTGTHPYAGNVYIKALVGTNAAGATTTGATLTIEGAMTGVTPTGNNDALSVLAGSTRLGGNLLLPVTVSSAGTLTLSTGGHYIFSGTTTTWTLPAVASSQVGLMYYLKNKGSGIVTINSSAGGNDIYSVSAVSTYALTAGSAIILVFDGTNFDIE